MPEEHTTMTAPRESVASLPPEPAKRSRRLLEGPERGTFTVHLKTLTPILGGAPRTREVDEVDLIRGPTVRGHLRFWWRALYAHGCASAKELALRERALWGGVGNDEGSRAPVEVHVTAQRNTASKDPQSLGRDSEGAYALWIAQAPRGKDAVDPKDAERWVAGLCFSLRIVAPLEQLEEVKHAVRAWILWGGYGSRTRRGLGALTVTEDVAQWLPENASWRELTKLFGSLPLFRTAFRNTGCDVPVLRGARLFAGGADRNPLRAWTRALDWLRDFRQGRSPGPHSQDARPFAREWGDAKRPGRSRWPEPDRIRSLLTRPGQKPWAHSPRAEHARAPGWPRAAFGLPIGIRFQNKGRAPGQEYHEPGDVELRWHDGTNPRERLASALIVKAMPLRNGTCVPIALWLCRAWPAGTVVLKQGKNLVPGSKSAFTAPLLAPGDRALFAPLKEATLQDAFFSWVRVHHVDVKELRDD